MTSPRSRRSSVIWIGRVTTGLLVGSVVAVALVAMPSFASMFADSLGSTLSSPASPGSPVRITLPHRTAEILNPSDPPLEADEDAPPETASQLGQTRQAVLLRERPLASATVLGRVDEGELVSILQVSGDWALVYYGGRDTLVAGWAKKSEIALR